MMSRMVAGRLTSYIVPLLVQLPDSMFVISIALLLLLSAIGAIVIVMNYRLRKQLNKTKGALFQSIQGKLDMVTNFNREVRTPLNALVGMSEQLTHTSLDRKQRELVHAIENAASMLQRMITNMQEVYTLEKGEVKLVINPFEIYTTFHTITEEKRKAAFEKGLFLEALYEGDQYLRVLGDEPRLKQVMVQLLDNAIRCTAQGGIQVLLRASKANDGKALIYLEVKDTGVGIAADMVPHLFSYDGFARPPQMAAMSGAGLGLAIVHKILQLHGTHIKVDSSPEKGSSFAFELTYPLADPSTLVITRQENGEMTAGSIEGRNILIADDQEMNLVLLSHILSRWKCNFDKAADGIAAYELFSQRDYDMVLLDIQMPGMTGLEVVKKIREDRDEQKARVPVLAITSDVTIAENNRYRALGFTDCMLKPFREGDIYNTITRYLPPAGVGVT